jgi:hypothetical protein
MSVPFYRIQLLFGIALAFVPSACNSTGVGNPGAGMTVTVRNDLKAEPAGADPAVELAPAQLRHAVLAFGELRFIPCDATLEDVVAPGPFLVDLVTESVEPQLPAVPIPPSGFCGLDAPLTSLAPNSSQFGNSILFSGVRADGALFILYAAMPGTLRMRPVPGITAWDATNAASVIWAMRPRRWLMPAELDAETSEPFGVGLRIIVIDVNRHPVLYAAIRNRVGARATLHTDLNDDGNLDDNERANALIGQGLPSLD